MELLWLQIIARTTFPDDLATESPARLEQMLVIRLGLVSILFCGLTSLM